MTKKNPLALAGGSDWEIIPRMHESHCCFHLRQDRQEPED